MFSYRIVAADQLGKLQDQMNAFAKEGYVYVEMLAFEPQYYAVIMEKELKEFEDETF